MAYLTPGTVGYLDGGIAFLNSGACQVHPLVINPKSVTLSELYGAYDLSTFEWADGILSTLFKQSAESDKPDEKVPPFPREGTVQVLLATEAKRSMS